MKVILLCDIENLGKKGDIKDVSDGYARNYLIPRKIALPANDKNISLLKIEKEKFERKRKREIERVNKIVDKLNKISINIQVKTGEGEKLFGAVTKEDIAVAIEKETGLKIDKHDILLEEQIKNTGAFLVDVRIKPEGFADEQPRIAKVKLWIIGEK